jgi:hypothetical protein
LEARRLVFECVDDPRLLDRPELRPNCVRIHYAGGYHVDVPVYRERDDGTLEHAGPEWHMANPVAVNEWFQEAVNSKSPDSTNGQQLRRIVRLVKRIATSRASWSLPSGFVLSKLVVDHYVPAAGRDDAALYFTLRRVRAALEDSLEVRHPVVDEPLAADGDPGMVCLAAKLDEVLSKLGVLVRDGCGRDEALVAWRFVFNGDLAVG